MVKTKIHTESKKLVTLKSIAKASSKIKQIREDKFEKDDLMNLLKEEITKVKDNESFNKKTDDMALLHTGFSNQKDIDLGIKQKQRTVDNAIKKDEQFTILSKALNLSSIELQQQYKIYTYFETGPYTESPPITNYPISYFFYNHLVKTLKDYTGQGDRKDIILLTNDQKKSILVNLNSISVQKMVYFVNSRDYLKYRDNKEVYLHPQNLDKSENTFTDILRSTGCTIRII